MFVVTVEGNRFMNKHLWASHKVIGVYEKEEEALRSIKSLQLTDEDVVLLTDLDHDEIFRIEP